MRILEDHVTAFRELSGDSNPLHSDAGYARRTPFGEPIPHGMAVALLALGNWLNGRNVSLRRIRGEFRRPFRVGSEIKTSASEQDRSTELLIEGDRGALARLEWTFAHGESASAWPEQGELYGVPSIARGFEGAGRELTPTFPDGINYSPEWRRAELFAAFGIRPGQLPSSQLAALLWASAFAGMVFPGRQALFAGFDFEFDGSGEKGRFRAREISLDYREDLRLATVSGRAEGVPAFSLDAFARPEPVAISAGAMARELGAQNGGIAESAVVVGGSRGLGRALALGLAGLGVGVGVISRTRSQESTSLRDDLAHASPGRASLVLEANAESAAEAASAFASLGRDLGPIDCVILAATPPIPEATLVDIGVAGAAELVARNIAIVASTALAALPVLSPVGSFILVSSEYAAVPPPGFAHYAAAKRAMEGIVMGLSAERPGLVFGIARPGRFLSDQTNAIHASGMPSAERVAAGILRFASSIRGRKGLHWQARA